MSFGVNLVRFFAWAQQVRKPLVKRAKGRALLVPLADALEARRLMTLNVWIQIDNSLVVTADDNTSQYLTLDYDAATTTYTITSFVSTENFSILTNNPTGLTVTAANYNPGTGDPATLTIVESTGTLNSIALSTGTSGDRFEDTLGSETGPVATVYINSGGGSDLITKNAGLNNSFLVVDGGSGDDVINFGLNSGTATLVLQNFSASPFDPAALALDTYVQDGSNFGLSNVRAANVEILNNQVSAPAAAYTATVNGAFGAPQGSFSSSTLRTFSNTLAVSSSETTVFGSETADQMILAPSVDAAGVQLQATGLPTTNFYGLTPATGVLRLLGLGGNDYLKAAAGVENLTQVSLDGGAGNDLLSGDATLSGGAGDDLFVVPSGINTIDGGTGFDTIQVSGTSGPDTIDTATTATTVDITVNGMTSTNTVSDIELIQIDALAGDDNITLAGTGTIAALINGGTGNDNANATGYNAVVTINGEAGDDTLMGGSTADYIDGGDGFDFLDGGLGNDSLEGGDGGDVFYWDEGDGLDSIDGGSGDNVLTFSGSASATNSFTIGVNTSFPIGFFVNLNNAFTGMETANIQGLVLQGGAVADNVLVQDMSGTSLRTLTIDLGGSSQFGSLVTFNGTTGNDVLGVGGSGSNVFVTGLPYAASLKGYVVNPSPSSIDTIQVNGNAGYDTMFVNASLMQSVAVNLSGGIGNDLLYSEAPNYLGQPPSLYRINLSGGAGVNEYTPIAGRVVVVGSDADIMHLNGNDLANTLGVSQSANVLTYTLGFSTTLVDVTSFTGMLSIDAKGGDDSVTLGGYSFGSVVYGGSGNDTIDASGLAVAVNVYGNDGNDIITGSTGNDTISGGAGEDQINAGPGDDYVDGDSGLDTITAGSGEDTLNGGADSDWFIVQMNGQTIYMDGGTGSDLLWLQGTSGDDALTMNSLFDSVVLQSGALDLNLTDTESYYIDLGDQADSLAVGDMTQVQIEMVQFVAGAGVNSVSIAGVVGDNNVEIGTNPAGAVIASGLGYLMEVSGSTTADTLSVDGGQGNDTIKAIAGVEGLIQIVLSGGEGNDYLSADATILGGDGNDTLVGGAGSDSLDGGSGDDLFIPSAALDTIEGGTGFDIVLLAGSVGMDNTFAVFQNTAVPVILNVNTASYSAVLSNINQVSVQGSTGNDSLTVGGDLASPVPVLGMMGAGNDWVSAWSASAGQVTTIYGQGGDDTMLSGAGTDNFFGGDDFDTFEAGPLSINSTDLFDGGTGYNALTVESVAAGSSVITPIASGYQVTNTAGTGVTTALNIGKLGVDLLLGGGIVINGSNSDDNIRTFDLDSDLYPNLPAGEVLVAGLPGEMTITGVVAGTVIEIHGQGGNDTFQDLGDAGATLSFHGDSGNDTFIVNQESEPAAFSGDAGTDTVAVTGTVSDELIWFSAGATQQEVYFGTIGLAGLVDDAEVLSVNALAGNDTIGILGINPATGLSVFNLNGQEGNDLVGVSTVAAGTFSLSGGEGNDTMIGPDGTATVLVRGDAGNDTIQLGSAGGSAYGDSGDDSLTGGSANDFLSGGDGNDTLSGAQGADVISGDAGDDVIAWNIGDGNDTVTGGTGANELIVNGDTVAPNAFTLQPQVANSVLFEVLIAGNVISAGDIAHVSLTGGSGSDTFNIADLTATGVTLVDTDFGVDTVADQVSVMGSAYNDQIILAGTASVAEVTGLPWLVRVQDMAFSASTLVDGILVDGGRGYDWLISGVLMDMPLLVTLQGGVGGDLLEVRTPAMGDNPNRVTVVANDTFTDTIKLINGRNLVLGGPNDIVEVNGSENNDSISLSGLSSPGRVDIAVNSMFSSNDLTGFAGGIQVNAAGGDDRVTFTSVSTPTTISGGDGNDYIDASSPTWSTDPALVNVTMYGGSGNDSLTAGYGSDVLDGGDGSDVLNLSSAISSTLQGGSGDDLFIIYPIVPGVLAPKISGGTGTDRVIVAGSGSNPNAFVLGPNTAANDPLQTSLELTSNGTMISASAFDVEGYSLNGGLQADTFNIQDLTGLGITNVQVSLADVGGDQAADQVTISGTASSDRMYLVGSLNPSSPTGSADVQGLPWGVQVLNSAMVGNTLVDGINLLAGIGEDTIIAGYSLASPVLVTLNGGTGFDDLRTAVPALGDNPVRVTIEAQNENFADTIYLFNGRNAVLGTPNDVIIVDGTNANDTIALTGSGGGSTLTINVNGTVSTNDLSAYSGTVVVDAQGGNDTVTLGGYGVATTVNGGQGNDSISASGMAVAVTLNGNSGDDTLTGGSVADYLDGGDGFDFITGGAGNDSVEGGDGGDIINWNDGDGYDEIDGGSGDNQLYFTGNDSVTNSFTVTTSTTFPIGFVVNLNNALTGVDTANIQGLVIKGGLTADNVLVQDMSGTSLRALNINLDGGSQFGSYVTFNGTTGNDVLGVGGSGSTIYVTGLTYAASVTGYTVNPDPASIDTIQVNGNAGYDTLFANASLVQSVAVVLSGGIGNDKLYSEAPLYFNQPASLYRVSLIGGTGLNEFTPTAGRVIVNGGAADIMHLDGNDLGNNLAVTQSGSILTYALDSATTLIDVSAFTGLLNINANGGNDTVTLGGYSFASSVFGGLGDDTINASGLAVPVSLYGGLNDDDLTGGSAADYLDGGDGYDFLTGGLGNDLVEGGSGGDAIFYSAGDGNDEVDGGEGFNTLFVSGYASLVNTINVNPSLIYPTDIQVSGNGLALDATAVQGVTLTGGTDADTFNIADLTGTCAQNLVVDFGVDSAADSVNFTGTAKADEINVHGGPNNSVQVGGLAVLATVINAALGSTGQLVDTVSADGSFGFDRLIASPSLAAIPVGVSLYGGGGYDLLIANAPALGSAPRVTLSGGTLDDTFWLQSGNNVVIGSAGDLIEFNATANADIITATGNTTTLNLSVNGLTSTNDVSAFAGVMQINALGGNDNLALGGYTIPTSVMGGDGNDTIHASGLAVPVSLYGGSGDDSILGGSGNDYIEGNDGSDDITGNAGNDRIYGGADIDTFYWAYGDGNDSIDGGTGQNNIDIAGDPANGNIFSLAPNTRLQGVAQVDLSSTLGLLQASILTASIQQVSLVGGSGQDTFNIGNLTGTAVTIVNTDFGQDTVADQVSVIGDALNDSIRITGSSPAQVLGLPWAVNVTNAAMNGNLLVDAISVNGGAGNDSIYSSAALLAPVLVTIDGGIGFDDLRTGTLPMGVNPVRVTIDAGPVDIYSDTIQLFQGRNRVIASSIDLILVAGSPSNDLVLLNQTAEGTVFNVNGTTSTNDLSAFEGVIQVDLQSGNDTATLVGYTIPTSISGGDGNDLVNAALLGANVTISGGSGNDTLYGSALGDLISGDAGNDDIYGNAGTDSLFGGEGNDDFIWTAGGGFDLIDGGQGDDLALFTGAAGVENSFTLTPLTSATPTTANGLGSGDANRVLVTHAGGQVSHFGDVEAVSLFGNGTCDTFGIGNLATTGLRVVDATFSPTTTGGVVATYATNLPDTITVTADAPDQIGVNGLAVPVRVFNATPATAIVVHGGFGADTFEVDPQAEAQAIIVIDGGSGNDTITGGSVIIGGPGNNLLIGSDLPNTIVGGTGSDTIQGLGSGDLLFGDALVTNIDDDGPNCQYLANLVITPTATGAPDLIDGGDGNDTINGNIGDDTIQGGSGNNEIGEITWNGVFFPEPGNDVISAADGDNEVHSGPGNDQVALGNGNNCVFAGEGTNTVSVGNGNNRIVTGSGNDTVTTGNGNNTIFSGAGDDTVTTGSGNDVVVLGAGNDKATLGDGNDLAWGEDGNDFIIGGMGNDTIYGGSGNDILWGGTQATKPVKNSSQVVTTPNDGNDVLAGEDGFDQLDGGTGNNIMDAGADNIRETMIGSGGWDTAYIHRNEGSKQDVLKNHTSRYTLIPYGSMPVAAVPATPTDCTSPINIVIPDPLSGKLAKAPVKSKALPKPTTKVVSSASKTKTQK